MLKLLYSPRSPFVRKVMIVLHETQQLEDVDLQPTLVALHLEPKADVLAENPLGKIPAMITDDGRLLFDSRVICEFLDTRVDAGLVPSDPTLRFEHLTLQAMADGLTDILLLWRTELTREAGPWTAVTDGWEAKVQATLSAFERDAVTIAALPFGIGHIALICALGQLDFRWSDCSWRDHFPQLAGIERKLAQRDSIKATGLETPSSGDEAAVTKGQLRFK